MKKTYYYILVSESIIGIHSKNKEGKRLPFELYDMTFIPNVIKHNEQIEFQFDEYNNTFQKIVSKYHTVKSDFDVMILVGFDLDLTGELMSSILRNALIKKQIPAENIIRTPLTEQGYIAFKQFTDISKYKEYLYLQKQFMNMQRSNGIKNTIGFQKAISLELLSKYKGKETLVDSIITSSSGTSTITVATKFLGGKGDFQQ